MAFTKNFDIVNYLDEAKYSPYFTSLEKPEWMEYASLSSLILSKGLGFHGVPNNKIEWESYINKPNSITVDTMSTSGVCKVDETDSVATGMVYFYPFTGQLFYVTEVTDATHIVVSEIVEGALKSSSLEEITTGTHVFNLVTRLGAYETTLTDAQIAELAVRQVKGVETNYMSLIERWVQIGKTANAIISRGDEKYSEREWRQKEALEEAFKDLEKILMVGDTMIPASSSPVISNLYSGKGLISFANDNLKVATVASNFDWTDLTTFTRKYVKAYYTRSKITAFANGAMIDQLISAAEGHYSGTFDASGKEDEIGLIVRKFRTPAVTLEVYESGALNDLYGDDYPVLVAANIADAEVNFVEGNGESENMHIDKAIQNPKSRVIQDRIGGQFALKIPNPEANISVLLIGATDDKATTLT